MIRNMHNEPIPQTPEEVQQAVHETGASPDATVMVFSPEPDNDAAFVGWTAEVIPDDAARENGFETAGFEDRDALVNALRAAGFRTIKDDNGKRV